MLDQSADLEQLAREVADLRTDVRAAQNALLEAQITPASYARVAATDIPGATTGSGVYGPATVLGDGVVTTDSIATGAITAEKIEAGAVTTEKLDLADEYGATILTSQGFGDTWARFIQTGLYNSDFRLLPAAPDSNISATNEVPYWTSFQVGTVVTAKSVVSSATASGRVIEFTVGTGGADLDRLTLRQIVPCVPSRGRGTLYDAGITIHTPSSVDDTVGAGVYGTWLDSDWVQIGDKVGGGYALDVIGADKDYELAWLFHSAPPTAQYLMVEPSVYRRGVAGTAAVVEISDLRVRMADTNLHIADDQYSADYGPGLIRARAGDLHVAANATAPTGHSSYISINGSTEAYGDTIYLYYDGTDEVSFGDNGDFYRAAAGVVGLRSQLRLGSAASKFMQSGTVSIDMAGDAAHSEAVVFPVEFDNTPIVLCTRNMSGGTAPKVHISGYSPSTTGFTALGATGDGTTSAATVTGRWLAIDMNNLA